MKKIMFSDAFGLTQAVLEGRKTMTRRIIKGKWFWERCPEGMWSSDEIKAWEIECEQRLIDLSQTEEWGKAKEWALSHIANYKVGDIVAVAQCYGDCGTWFFPKDEYGNCAGYTNKMFVKADLMPHKIRITDIKAERLQDISDEDCLREGITYFDDIGKGYMFDEPDRLPYRRFCSNTPRAAFAMLIDKVSGKGTWDRNPLVFAYTFELVN